MVTKAQARVKLAQDVIAQIKRERYVAEAGSFVDIEGTHIDEDIREVARTVLAAKKEKEALTCRVCALGGAFVSSLNLFPETCGSITRGNSSDFRTEIRERLEKWFSNHQLNLIESAFECSHFTGEKGYADNSEVKEKDIDRAIEFGRRYDNDEDRIVGIMRNVIRNKGSFCIPKSIR